MGATHTRRSSKPLGFSREMPIFSVLSMRGVSAGFLGIRAGLWVAEETYRTQEYLVSSRCGMATIKARKQANGAIRNTAIVRIRRGKTIVHRESKTFTFRA